MEFGGVKRNSVTVLCVSSVMGAFLNNILLITKTCSVTLSVSMILALFFLKKEKKGVLLLRPI